MTATTATGAGEDRRGYGIAILLVAQLALVFIDPSAKWLAAAGVPTNEIIFIRYAMHLALVVGFFWPSKGRTLLVSRAPWLELWRGLALFATTAFNFVAIQYLPLTVTGTIMFTSPLIICLLAGPLLGEHMDARRWVAVGVGFVGILVIVQPGTDAFHPTMLLSLAGAAAAALYSILTRRLAGTDSAATQQFYAALLATACITPFAFQHWVWPSDWATWIAFIGVGASGMLGHQLMTVAHRFAPASTLAPFTYLQIVHVSVVSWLLFAQPPDLAIYLGAPIIIGSGIYLWLRERRPGRGRPGG